MTISFMYKCPICNRQKELKANRKPAFHNPVVIRYQCTHCECDLIVRAWPKTNVSGEKELHTETLVDHVSSKGQFILNEKNMHVAAT